MKKLEYLNSKSETNNNFLNSNVQNVFDFVFGLFKFVSNLVLRVSNFKFQRGQSLVEILLAIGLSAIILPALLTGLVSSRQGKAQQNQRTQAVYLLNETVDSVRSVREKNWAAFAVNGIFHPVISGSNWNLATGSATVNSFTQSVIVGDVNRNTSGVIVSSGGTLDPSTKKADISISWGQPYISTVSATLYITRYLNNNAFSQTTVSNFSSGILNNTQITATAGGEVALANNNKAKWCSPAISSTTIDLPDGPPVAVAAIANSTSSNFPNDVFVATAPNTSNSIKLAYVNVTANTDNPVATLRGKFTLDASQYSNAGYVPSGLGLTNAFKTNDIKYYVSPSGKTYALIATDLPAKEVIAVLVNDGDASNDGGTTGEFQDPVNKIYKYWTFFNTVMHGLGMGIDTGYMSPTANGANTGGDNDGFESNPTRAYTDNSSFAVDSNSGSDVGTSCTGTDKDKHRFYNYDFSLPNGAAIDGIEVRLDAKVDSNSGAPKMCVQISWDGGTTWTAAKSTPGSLTTSETTYILGSSSDTWGRTWSDTNFTNSNFRLRVVNVASKTARDFSLDWAAVKVYYSGGISSTNDQAPFDYGATSLTVSGNKGYVASGGYLYSFDLSNIDSKSPASGLDMIGCRIELDGYDCKAGSPATAKKYDAGQTGTSWSNTSSAIHNDCSDGGNIELFATNDIYPVQVASNTYIYVAVGGVTNPEFEIANVSTPPTYSRSTENSCGTISGGDSTWKRISSYDFNSVSNTEEAANSVYAKSDGTRAYISSNGGIDGDHNGQPDSKQFYILNTSNKNSPAFLSGSPSSGPTSGYYYGTGAQAEMYPRRSLTVLNGDRVVLVGKDAITNGNDAREYQVLDSSIEATPNYCGGVNFDQGFNGLTSVSENDGDNFVYMVANTTVNELKIIQGGPDTGLYASSGTYESSIFDPSFSAQYNSFSASISQPSQTTIKAQVAVSAPVGGSCNSAVFNYVGPNGIGGASPSAYFIPSGSLISGVIPFENSGGYQNPNRCFRYKFYFDTTDFNKTPVLNDIFINYSP